MLLLIPIQLKIDSINGIYQAEWKNICKANLLLIKDEPIARLKLFFWKKDFNLLEIKPKTKTVSKTKKEKSKKRKPKFYFQKKVKKFIKVIHVKQLYLNIDTNDYVWNAYLYPIFFFSKKEKRELQINFQGNVELLLEIYTRPIRILFVLLF